MTMEEFVRAVYPNATITPVMGKFFSVVENGRELGRGPTRSVAWNHACKTIKLEESEKKSG